LHNPVSSGTECSENSRAAVGIAGPLNGPGRWGAGTTRSQWTVRSRVWHRKVSSPERARDGDDWEPVDRASNLEFRLIVEMSRNMMRNSCFIPLKLAADRTCRRLARIDVVRRFRHGRPGFR
jgi:hypothetical protein